MSEVGGSVVGVVSVSGADETGGRDDEHDDSGSRTALGELVAVGPPSDEGWHVGAPTVGDDCGEGLDLGAGLVGAPG